MASCYSSMDNERDLTLREIEETFRKPNNRRLIRWSKDLLYADEKMLRMNNDKERAYDGNDS
jgi:hypothetical protein